MVGFLIPSALNPISFVVTCLAGWLNEHQQDSIDYLTEENRVLREQIGDRLLRVTDDQRRRLAARAKALSRSALEQVATLVTPWTFQTVEEPAIGQCGQTFRSHGRPARIAAESLQAHTITGFDTDIGMHTEAGNHGAAGVLEGIQAVSVDLISQAHDATAGIGTDCNPATYGVGQQVCHPGIAL